MKILRSVLDCLDNQIKDEPPEVGGILGSEDGETISLVFLDDKNQDKGCFYEPNIKLLNAVISEWLERGYKFKGIFHTHFEIDSQLSNMDKVYIGSIMKAMPTQIKELYFPVYALPKRELVVYKAWLKAGILQLQKEPTEII